MGTKSKIISDFSCAGFSIISKHELIPEKSFATRPQITATLPSVVFEDFVVN